MAFPSDINLPGSSRYYTFIETKKNFNSTYDLTWSFSYYLPASSIQSHNNYQFGFSTFLTSLSSPISSLPGQYLGDQDPSVTGNPILTEFSSASSEQTLLTEGSEAINLETGILSGSLIKIAFDSTGFYAISGREGRPGVGLETDCIRESMVVRDFDLNVIANTALSAMSSSFDTLTTNKWRTLRFRYVNLGRKLHIDFHEQDTTTFTTLTTLNVNYSLEAVANTGNIFIGFSLSTPISTSNYALSAKNFYLRNLQIEGYEDDTVLTETVTTPLLSTNPNTPTTTVTNISA